MRKVINGNLTYWVKEEGDREDLPSIIFEKTEYETRLERNEKLKHIDKVAIARELHRYHKECRELN